jgi:cation transport regulator ChaC
VEGAPGRVVTLLPQAHERCWGVAYAVAEADRAGVLDQLDHREKGGYARHHEPVRERPDAPPFATALVYVATPDNENYLGCAPLPAIADQVVNSRGPSGKNSDYVLRLAAALRAIGAHDDHVFRLEALVLARLSKLE